jgi:putative Ca2+/H+ antiporter (TMEM165/GDT1 family)
MDALLLALLLTLMLDQGSGTQRLVAHMSDTGAPTMSHIVGLGLMTAINAIVAAGFGAVMAAILMPDARLLFLAVALMIGAVGLLTSSLRKPPERDALQRRTGFRTLCAFLLRRGGENGAFAVAGVAAFTDAPILAAIGATVGGWVALVPPLALGTIFTRHDMLRLFQLLSGAILLCVAITCAASALRLL